MEIVSCRGFEKVCRIEFEKSETHIDYDELELPKRATKFAAGYDIKSTLNFTLKPGEDIVIPTGFKAYMQPGEMLALFPRSGMGFKYQIQLANTVGIGDGDYYNCESNEGHYFIKLVNRGKKDWEVKVGDGIGQAIFMPVLLADDDDFESGEERKGGFGSTDKLEEKLCSKAREPKYNVVLDECHELMNSNVEIKDLSKLEIGESVEIFDRNDNSLARGKLVYVDGNNIAITRGIITMDRGMLSFDIDEHLKVCKVKDLNEEELKVLASMYGYKDKNPRNACQDLKEYINDKHVSHTLIRGRENIISRRVVQTTDQSAALDLSKLIEVETIDSLSAGTRVIITDANSEEIISAGVVSKIICGDNTFVIRKGSVINYTNLHQYSFNDKNIKVFKYKGTNEECKNVDSNNSESLFTIFEDYYIELKNSDIGKVGLDILDNIKTKLINNELDSHCIGLLGHLMGKDKLNELLQKLTDSEFYEVVDGNNFIALPNNNSFQEECQEMYAPKLDGFTATPIRVEDRNIDVPALVKEYIDKNTGDIVHIHDGLKVGQPVLVCDRNKTKIYYVGVINSINKKDNTLCVTTHLLNGKDEIEIYRVNDPKITMLTYKSPEDISRPEPSRSIKINTVKYLDVKDTVCVTFAFSKEILCAGEITKIEGDKISILVAPDLNERGTVVVDLNTKELAIYKKCAYETLESIYPGIDVKSATSYFKHNLFTEVKDIQTLKKGNLIFGVEQYGPKRRVCSGMVDDIYPEYAYVMANDSYNGARGTHINTEYGKIFKISLEDIPNGTFKNKVIDYIIEEVNTK